MADIILNGLVCSHNHDVHMIAEGYGYCVSDDYNDPLKLKYYAWRLGKKTQNDGPGWEDCGNIGNMPAQIIHLSIPDLDTVISIIEDDIKRVRKLKNKAKPVALIEYDKWMKVNTIYVRPEDS